MEKQRILIAEDHTILRQGLRALLESSDHLQVVGDVSTGKEAIRAVAEMAPTLVIIDLSMPGMNGTEAIREIRVRHPDVRIIALTVHKAEEYVRTALKAGADGYVLKDDSHADLMSAVRNVLNGRTYLSPGICTGVISGYVGTSPRPSTGASWEVLTHREREVMKLIAEGYKNRQIAHYLSLSTKTVEKHRANLMKKLNLHNAAGITAYAIENGLRAC